MPKPDSLGQFEQLLLTAILTLREEAYGVSIHSKASELARPKDVSLGAVYVTLDRLEDKGMVSSRLSDPTPERGGRAKRCYQLEALGERALQESAATAKRILDVTTEIWERLGEGVGETGGQALGQGNSLMPPGPPKALEAFVGFWIPPACREEVLGDLHEKYAGPWQYTALAMWVVPFVILSRIRRTTDIFVLLTEALLIYGSFLAAMWYTDKASLTGQWGLLRLAIPTVVNLAVLILEHAWNFETRWASALINGAVIGIGVYFSWPGEFASVLLVGAVEFAFRRWANLPQAAAGPALWLKQRPESAAASFRAKFALAAAVVITLEAFLQAVTGAKPALVGVVIIIVAAIGVQVSRSRKE